MLATGGMGGGMKNDRMLELLFGLAALVTMEMMLKLLGMFVPIDAESMRLLERISK